MISKKKFVCIIVILVIVNVCVIGGVILFYSKAMSGSSEEGVSVDEASITDDATRELEERNRAEREAERILAEKQAAIDELRIQDKDDAFLSIYKNIIVGSGTLMTDDGKNFTFNNDGTYYGYYDDEQMNVSGYLYNISDEDGIKLSIFNPDGEENVTYSVLFDEESGDVILNTIDYSASFVLHF